MSKPMVSVCVTNFHFVKPGLIAGVNEALAQISSLFLASQCWFEIFEGGIARKNIELILTTERERHLRTRERAE